MARAFWITGALVWLGLGIWLAAELKALTADRYQEPSRWSETIKSRTLKLPPVAEIDFGDSYFKSIPNALIHVVPLYPSPSSDPSPMASEDCNSPAPKGTKPRAWWRHICHGEFLPEGFFKSAPHIHPRGGSWVAYAFQNRPEFRDSDWLAKFENEMHLFERIHLLHRPRFEILRELTMAEFSYLMNRQSVVLSERFAFLRTPGSESKYSIFRRSDWDAITAETPVTLQAFDPHTCLAWEGFQCWVENSRYTAKSRIRLAGMIGGGALVIVIVLVQLIRDNVRTRRRAATDRKLLVQTLAHELRHPVTGLRLSLESFRDEFDALPETLQVEFLSMAGQLRKLQGLINASEQYLNSESNGGHVFQFKTVRLDSFNDYLANVTDNYRGKINLHPLDRDMALDLDPYWLGMCISNLIKNALIHGRQPIDVTATFTGGTLCVAVTDSGAGLSQNPRDALSGNPQISTRGGMGLGLGLVVRLTRLMGGNLKYEARPRPTFSIFLRIIDEKQNLAG